MLIQAALARLKMVRLYKALNVRMTRINNWKDRGCLQLKLVAPARQSQWKQLVSAVQKLILPKNYLLNQRSPLVK